MQLRDTLRHYAWVIRYRLGLIGLGMITCICGTIGINLYLPPIYQASALITVNGANSDIYSNEALAFSYAFLVTKGDVLQAAARQLPGMTVSQLYGAVSDSPITNTPMIEVRAQSDSAQRAALIANIVARSFIQVQIGKVSAELHNQDIQLSQILDRARTASDEAQTRLTALQARHALANDVGHQRNLLSTAQANYAALLDNYHHLQSLELQTQTLLNISQAATPPEQPIGSNLWLNAGLAAALSLLLLVTIALVLDWMDETIKTGEDVSQLTTLNALGNVPDCVSKGSNAPGGLPAWEGVIEEAFVAISSELLAQCEGKQSILVTGLHPQSGISTVATNLAKALAHAGVRVLLIDANLRRPALDKVFEYYHIQNLVNCLAEMRMFQDAQKRVVAWLNQWRTRTPYLWLLPAGPISLRPASFLAIRELRLLVQELLACRIVDMIIFDSASLHEGADVLAVAAVADATVLVIEACREKKEALDRAGATFGRLNAPVLGVVINRWHKRLHSYFYTGHSPSERELTRQSHLSLPADLRASLRAQALTTKDVQARLILPEVPPSLAQISQRTSRPMANEPAKQKVSYGILPARPVRVPLSKRKGIFLPIRTVKVADADKSSGLRQFMNTSEQSQ